MAIQAQKLLDAVTATGAGAARAPRGAKRTFQLTGATSAGAGAAACKVQGSNDGSNWIDLATISLTLSSTTATDGFTSDAPWAFIRGNVASISGTNAAVTLWMGD